MGRKIQFHYKAETRRELLNGLHAVHDDPYPYDAGILRSLLQAILHRIRNQQKLGATDSYHIETLIEDIAVEEWRFNNDSRYRVESQRTRNASKRIRMLIETIAVAPSETSKVACVPKVILLQRDELLEYLSTAHYPHRANNVETLVKWLNDRGSVFLQMLKILRCTCRYPSVFPTLTTADMKKGEKPNEWRNLAPVAELILSRVHGCNPAYIWKLIKKGEQHREKGIKDFEKLVYPQIISA